jgi:D-glycero-D-manno-heptose 1,7-bisphosphate phosphatase
MGTPARLKEGADDLAADKPARRNLHHKQRAVFLDRDGTLNESRGFISRPEDFALLPGAALAVKRVNDAGLLAIVATNQPVIARGTITIETLRAIHDEMETQLGREGAYLTDIFYCPHHPDAGFPDERPEYKIDCDCRKPKPGMLTAAAAKYNINLAASWMIGDSYRDIGAGAAAGCSTAFIGTEATWNAEQADKLAASLAETKSPITTITPTMFVDSLDDFITRVHLEGGN